MTQIQKCFQKSCKKLNSEMFIISGAWKLSIKKVFFFFNTMKM